MRRLTFAEFRASTQDARNKALTVGLSRYTVTDYVGPIVASGLRAVDRACGSLAMRDYDEDNSDDERQAYRDLDATRIITITGLLADQENDWAKLGDLKLDWPAQHKALRTYGGQQTFAKLLRKYLGAMDGWSRDCDAIEYATAIPGVSGVMPGHAKINALDMGFSPDGIGILTRPWMEVLMLLGIQFAPILVRDDLYSVHWHGDWHSWRVVERIRPYFWAFDPVGIRPLG